MVTRSPVASSFAGRLVGGELELCHERSQPLLIFICGPGGPVYADGKAAKKIAYTCRERNSAWLVASIKFAAQTHPAHA